MIDISIIVPIYNAEKYLKKCLDSLVNQTHKNIEIILLNDGSTDGSEKIIKTYHDERIRYYKQKNQGIGKTRNLGIEKAKGKYLLFVDSDDYVDQNICELLYQKAETEELDVVVCNFYRVLENSKQEEKVLEFSKTTLEQTPDLLLNVNLSPWNKLYKTSLIKKHNIKFIENLKYEDVPFVIDSLYFAKQIGKVEEALIYYVIHSKSETTIRNEKVFDILKIIEIVRKRLSKNPKYEEVTKRLIVKTLTNYTVQQRYQTEKKIANQFIDECFQYMEKYAPDYKKNKYYEKRGILRRSIEKNKTITKIYCNFYRNWTQKRNVTKNTK